MPDALTNAEIALLCDIGEFDLDKASEEQKRGLKTLLAGGYVEMDESRPGSPFKPTAKGMTFLNERGAGLNEA